MTQRPDLFNAVVCVAPLLDMVRYTTSELGPTWTVEYGDPEDAEQFGWLHDYSPYHRVVDGTDYPATMFAVFDNDTRTDPMHGRKMCAAAQHATSGTRPILLRTEGDVGHGARSLVEVGRRDGGHARLPRELDRPVMTAARYWPRTRRSGRRARDWLLGVPLQILIIVVTAFVVQFVLTRTIRRVVARGLGAGQARAPGADAPGHPHGRAVDLLLTQRTEQRAAAIGTLLRSVIAITVWTIAMLMILPLLGIDVAPLLASAGVVGVALGFGAQTLVKDYLSGIFLIVEDQFGVGDMVDLGPVMGTVEEVALRFTRLRDPSGVVWYVRNGEILRVANRSQGWTMAIVDIPIALQREPRQGARDRRGRRARHGRGPELRRPAAGPPVLRRRGVGVRRGRRHPHHRQGRPGEADRRGPDHPRAHEAGLRPRRDRRARAGAPAAQRAGTPNPPRMGS